MRRVALSFTLSFTLCATASTAVAQQLVPMAPQIEPAAGPLTHMESTTSQQPLPLQPLSTPVQPSTTLQAMLLALPDADVSLTPYNRPGAPEIMYGRQQKAIVNPVPALLPLAPPLHITPTSQPPLVLPKPKSRNLLKTIFAAADNAPPPPPETTPTQSAPSAQNPISLPVSLTDTALSPNPSIPTTTRPEDQLLTVDVTLNNIPRKTLLDIYQDDQQTLWLPITPLAQLLEIPLTVNAAAGVAQGWYQTTSNTVLINLATNKATVGKQSFPIGTDIEKHATDLYLSAHALKQWFGIETRLDYAELRLYIKTPKPLPGDLHAARTANWETIEASRHSPALPSDTLIPAYADFSLPVLRLGASSNFTKPTTGSAAVATGLTVQSENDMFGLNTNLTLSFAQSTEGHTGFGGGNLLLQKSSETPTLLGPLKARYFGFGDINTDPIPLSGNASHGRGATVSNRPQGTVTNPDQYILTGPAPINWDVEVYQNNTLVAFSHIDSSGTYRFTALPLRTGRNLLRLVFYGPNGETEERRETLYLADSIPAPHEWQYTASALQPNRSLIPGGVNEVSTTAATAQVQLATGLSKNWGVTFGAFRNSGEDTITTSNIKPEEQGLATGLRGSLGGSYITADAFSGLNGQATQASLRTPLTESIDLRLSNRRNYGYQPADRDELTNSQAEVTVPFKLGRASLDTGYGLTRTTYQTMQQQNAYTQRTSLGFGSFNATNQLDYTLQGPSKQLNGTLDTTSHIGAQSWRAGLNYQPDSEQIMRQFYVNTQLPVARNQTANFTYTQQLTDTRTANLAASTYWNRGPLALGLQGSASSAGNLQVGLNLTTALVPSGQLSNLKAARWQLSQPNATIGQGQASVRVFADENANGTYEPGEALLSNVTLTNRQRGTEFTTNAMGVANMKGLTPNTLARIEIDLTTLPDIYLKPISDTLNVKPHAGDNGTLNYAVRLYGEISGQALTNTNRPIQNLKITLLDATGKKADAATTESDGYYTFGALPMGTYTLTTTTTSTTLTLTSKSRIQTQNLTVPTTP